MIELLAVMMLMFIMMGIATTALRGVMRGSGIRGAASAVRATVTQARQQAMNNGQRVAVLLHQPADTGNGTMRTVMSFGRVAEVSGDLVAAENDLPWQVGDIGNSRVYHFRSASGGRISGGDPQSRVVFRVSGLEFREEPPDEIALEIGTRRELPSGMRFDIPGNFLAIVFNADGSLDDTAGENAFSIVERAGSPRGRLDVSIAPATGRISVDIREDAL